ncbi:bacillithiol biosynthesis deacetylase BshB1 [Cohnella sp. CIP 111063]|uniref:bacillithiol biosynthesis deacetylase BshB1 n=1 Tax=unclassified Cohnella TaxID=2636738 RepID=UPI000B8BBA5A|nr:MULTISPECIES: bacillithiol biosynthesis deacetylase BshB1 [unclassified Cohnella]OXS61164.1 bacillithiol biosynthesis deacetylase BshB1 [Cohnella sp. CIP 111063]PRX73722.1 bacillithiol biosynthesis deacetylase BshB1 [Cohnella sp. SGD-V74]
MSRELPDALDMLVFAAHPDDAEIGMGGTIAKHAQAGLAVGIVDLTYAEMSSNGNVETRQREAKQASETLGLAVRENLGLPDRGLAGHPEQIAAMVDVIRKYRPRIVFAPYFIDRHPDHIACSRMAEEAVFNAKLRKVAPELPAWTVEQLYFYFINDAHVPQLLIDISDVQETKMAALRAYRSQFAPEGSEADWVETPLTGAYLDNIVARDRLLGQPRKLQYAEGFIAKGPIALERF